MHLKNLAELRPQMTTLHALRSCRTKEEHRNKMGEYSKIKRESIAPSYDPRPIGLQKTTSQEIDTFREDLKDLVLSCM